MHLSRYRSLAGYGGTVVVLVRTPPWSSLAAQESLVAASHDPPDSLGLHLRVLASIEAVAPDEHLRGVAQSLQRLCRAVTGQLRLLGAVVELTSASGPEAVVAASDDRVAGIGELGFTTGEGPGIEAFRNRRPVHVADLEGYAAGRWPGYTAAAVDAGVLGVFAFPLHVGAARLAVLELYRAGPGPLTAAETALAVTYADIGTGIFLDAQSSTVAGRLDSGFEKALDYRAEIAQAQGMVMIDLGTGIAEALVLLRAHAFTHDVKLIDLARHVVAGYRLPGPADA